MENRIAIVTSAGQGVGRVARLAGLAGIAAQIGYKPRLGGYGSKPAVVAENTPVWQFQMDALDKIWVSDITYIKTHEVWLYLSVVIDLCSAVWSGGRCNRG